MFEVSKIVPSIEYIKNFSYPIISIDTLALIKMNEYVDQCSSEIAWLGIVDKSEYDIKDKDDIIIPMVEYCISDVFLVGQEVTGVKAEIDETALVDMGTKLIQSGQTELFNKIKLWGHSHVNMGVFASSTDDETFEEFYKNSDFFIRIIANKKDDISVDLMDCEKGVKFMNLRWWENKTEDELKILDALDKFRDKRVIEVKTIAEKIEIEIKDNILKSKPVVTNYSNSYANNRPTWKKDEEDDDDEKKKKEKKEKTLISMKDGNVEKSILIIVKETNFGVNHRWVEIDELISEEEIYYNIMSNATPTDIKVDLQDMEEFSYYIYNDWQNLIYAMKEYYKLFNLADETNGYLTC